MRHATHPLRSFPSPMMKWLACAVVAAPAVLLASATKAADAPAPTPGAAPAPAALASPVPTTDQARPVLFADAAPPPAAEKPSRILVLPFGTVGGRAGDTWLGRSIQQSVLTDLMTSAGPQAASASETPADEAAAADLGRKLGARYVVFGQVHVNNTAVRVTGEILSAETGQPVGALKATGSMNDLFPIEDMLGDQARRALGRIQFADVRGGNAGNPGGPPTAPANPPVAPQEPTTIPPTGPVQAPYAAGAGAEAPYTYTPYPQVGADTYYGTPLLGYDPYPAYSYPAYYYPYSSAYIVGGFGFGGRDFGRGLGGREFGRGGFGGGRFGGGTHFGGTGHVGVGGHFGGGHVRGGGHAGGHR